MPHDILTEICAKRNDDIKKSGFTFGAAVPEKRLRPITPFLKEKGAILEIKRASPSKGIINKDLDAFKTATLYAKKGARAISVLTEKNYFHGSLNDLLEATKAVDEYNATHLEKPVAVLRKDFLSSEEEVEVSYKCGADAVLLIARILTKEKLISMTKKCAELGITAFIEVRLEEDVAKFIEALRLYPTSVAAGVNARNLSDFSIDSLYPAGMLKHLRDEIKNISKEDNSLNVDNLRVVYESGIMTPQAAGMVGHLGFNGMLLGEGAVRNPENIEKLTSSFTCNSKSQNGDFWIKYGSELQERNAKGYFPFIKVCGITQVEDAVEAAKLGADFIGFIFSTNSKRNVSPFFVRKVYKSIQQTAGDSWKKPQLVGVITDPSSQEAKDAFSLVRCGILDVIQFHGCKIIPPADFTYRDIPRYAAVKIGSDEDIETLKKEFLNGEPRVLIDAKVKGKDGGTGVNIDSALVSKVKETTKLWLAGGVSEENISTFLTNYRPELIDVASRIEDTTPSAPAGKKNISKLKKLFTVFNETINEINRK